MKFEELSAADQQLLNTDLGEIEKVAAERVAIADEMYAVGFSKLASETADELDALIAMEKDAEEAEDLQLDDATEKLAYDLSAFIERGFFDGLCKLGSERHGDEMAYLYPFLEEKIAAKAAKGVLDRVGKFIKAKGKAVAEGAKDAGKYVKEKAEEGVKAERKYRQGAVADIKGGAKSLKKSFSGKNRLEKAKSGLKGIGLGAAKLSPYAAVPAAGAYGAKKLYDSKKKDSASAGE